MPLLSRVFGNKKGRDGSTAVVNTSAAFPTSGTASGDNFQGASKASADVMTYLDSCFDEFDGKGLLLQVIFFQGILLM
jgi:hypothetical protein